MNIYIYGVHYSALMKLIICHFGHGAGITNEHMTLDPKMTRLKTMIYKEPERKDRHKNTREVISEKVSALCLFTYMTVRPGARARQRYLPLVHNWVAEDSAHIIIVEKSICLFWQRLLWIRWWDHSWLSFPYHCTPSKFCHLISKNNWPWQLGIVCTKPTDLWWSWSEFREAIHLKTTIFLSNYSCFIQFQSI